METRANYIVVGLFVVGLCTIFVVALFWFTAGQQQDYDRYLVYMNESVSGLNKQGVVRFNGVDVGSVIDIDLNPKNPQQVKLLLAIDPETPINQSTTATLMSQGITGITYVGLKAGAVQAPPLQTPPGSPYPVIPSTPSLLTQLDTVLREASVDFKKISKAIQELLNESNQKAIREILANVDKFSSTLAENSEEVDQGIKSAAKSLKSTESFTQTLSEQTAPATVDTLNRLSRVLSDVEQLANTIKQNPSVLIRGSAPPVRGPGE